MKNKTLISIISIIFIFSSCNCDCTKDITPDGYIPGYAILLATSTHPTGIIKINGQDHFLRGVVYEYDNNQDFNVYDDIYFKIIEKDGIQVAIDILNDAGDNNVYGPLEIQNIGNELNMNLHNAVYTGFDWHGESNYHKRGHLFEDTQTLQFQFRQNQNQEEQEVPENEQIEIDGKTYEKVTFCETKDRTNCQFLYMKSEDFQKYKELPEDQMVYFQIAPKMINNFTYNIIIDFSTKHIHFGDRENFVEPEN